MTAYRKKLIEVALPLVKINLAAAREKSIRHGHPSTLHLWWARRPLAACRAVLFSSLVDDPSAEKEFQLADGKVDEDGAGRVRARLFTLIEELVLWENSNNPEVLHQAKCEIARCICTQKMETDEWKRDTVVLELPGAPAVESKKKAGKVQPVTALEIRMMKASPEATQAFLSKYAPPVHDPFAGGGSIPLEAQRLGLEAHASDLNPVAVLINKAMIEIPPKFARRSPVGPVPKGSSQEDRLRSWPGAAGLAEDVRRYGQWMRDEAEKKIGHLYPKIKITAEMAQERPDLERYVGQELTVIAWLWARTVKSPNPAFAEVAVPLASTFMLSTKPGKEAYVEPVIEGSTYRFTVKVGKPENAEAAKNGTKLSRGANFKCLMSDAPIASDHIYSEANAGRMGARLMAIVAEGARGRVYLSPTASMEAVALQAQPKWKPEVAMPENPRWFSPPLYGLKTYGDLFTPRQLVALTTFSDLVGEARERVKKDALAAGTLPDDNRSLDQGGTGPTAYADAVAVYLSLALSRLTDICNALCRWETSKTQVRNLFGRQAIPMMWDFAENNIFAEAAGDYGVSLGNLIKALMRLPAAAAGYAVQSDAQRQQISQKRVVSTDPPYYDNIGYADLSDFFYVWLRRSLQPVLPALFSTVAVPKAEELVATPYRHDGKENAEKFFLDGMTAAMHQLAVQAIPDTPITIYYAFKQSESEEASDSDSENGTANSTTSTGWETFLAAVIKAGFALTGTWPMRTELSNRMIGSGTNALASSIVLVCRKRPTDAGTTSRREFLSALKSELPNALKNMQASNIAPVDLAQASIGPGMAIYTRYAKVLDAAGKEMTVKEALALINQTLDETLAEQEGDFDADTRWALTWFDQNGFEMGDYGQAEQLSKSRNTSVGGLVEGGIVVSKKGEVRLLKPEELSADWDPATDKRLTVWETVHHLIRVLTSKTSGSEAAAGALAAKLGSRAEVARELAYRLYVLCERKKRAQEAGAYNALVQSWPEITRLARENKTITQPEQPGLF